MFTSNDHFDVLDITQDKTRKMTHTVEQIKQLMGSPRNYGKCKKNAHGHKRWMDNQAVF